MIKDSGERTQFDSGAVRDMHGGKGRMDLVPWYAVIELSKHCEDGAKKYGERNVDKGIPQHSLIDSAFRHLAKYTQGETDEPHLRAAAWNIMWALQQTVTKPEMVDICTSKTLNPGKLACWACGCVYDGESGVETKCPECGQKQVCERIDIGGNELCK